ncbi:saccharopine dehydrogenase (NAD+, L-lysine-forming) [Synchytrium endobioticum]|uniref:Saccharopine dehydrogenase [NAD(+), L-lysine-forming] n=1 Tax=Synchytrium endobioticum TaxID=286115 RepID=A0A507CUU8_9FUNG|nr:saccharopine dehydrogenase (NAD+, L-lysine-forming) [Synchytrium endobioticum]TPX46062.1 saccharopine dehydrogenase (NAD+, L-lysine-forming) [Synchytrium endobioticum]
MHALAPHLWLRAETKRNEHRTALTPSAVKVLIEAGFQITVEKSPQSIFNTAEYAQVAGVELADAGTWQTAPKETYVVGLKELPENDSAPLPHTHIMFAHCYKRQSGWRETLSRFARGHGLLLDLEFLQDDNGRRVAAFGYHAGFAGSALALDVWAHQRNSPGTEYPYVKPYPTDKELIAHVAARLASAVAKCGTQPTVMVMGALGRCGRGAIDMARAAGIPDDRIVKWDVAETAKGGPFAEILDASIFVNCIYLSTAIPPFLTVDMLQRPRELSVVCDVSCDTTNPNNPLPIYADTTTFGEPVLHLITKGEAPLDVIAIDHLPTLLPREASEAFSRDLLPSLLQLKERHTARVWTDAEALFHKKVEEMKSSQ